LAHLEEPEATLREELLNALSHGLAALVTVGAGAVMITLAAQRGNTYQIVSASVFCGALLLLMVASTLYHAITHRAAKARLKVFDHCAIFALIAGTYTPFTLVSLQKDVYGNWGWSLFGLIWGLALVGIVFKLFYTGRFKGLSTAIYLAMGWLVLLAIKPIWQAVDGFSLTMLFAGGMAYTLGAGFYMAKRIPYSHVIWHLFVIIGSACHFIAVFGQVTQAR
jgi:hemolysin III